MEIKFDHETRVASLKTLFLFQDLSHELLLELSKLTIIRSFSKNEVIYEQGELPSRFTFVNAGMIKLVRALKPGQEMILKLVTEGECFGTTAIFLNQPYLARSVCEGEVTLIEIPKDLGMKFLDRHPHVYRKFLELSCNKHYHMVRKVPEMALNRIETRVAKKYRNLNKKNWFKKYSFYQLDIPLTRKEIAAMAGTTTETVVRVLGRLEKTNVIEMNRQHIILRNLPYLESLVDEFDRLGHEGID